MRRQLRAILPEWAHWFNVKPWEVENLTYGEIAEFNKRLSKLPPIGGFIQYQAK